MEPSGGLGPVPVAPRLRGHCPMGRTATGPRGQASRAPRFVRRGPSTPVRRCNVHSVASEAGCAAELLREEILGIALAAIAGCARALARSEPARARHPASATAPERLHSFHARAPVQDVAMYELRRARRLCSMRSARRSPPGAGLPPGRAGSLAAGRNGLREPSMGASAGPRYTLRASRDAAPRTTARCRAQLHRTPLTARSGPAQPLHFGQHFSYACAGVPRPVVLLHACIVTAS